MITKSSLSAYIYLLTLPGVHRWYLNKKGSWYFLAIATLAFLGLINALDRVFYLGVIAYACLFIWDGICIPRWVSSISDPLQNWQGKRNLNTQ